ncbi:uncharacterized protein [Diadema setosum]|uniref:uncharacterized protein n=1 Tax=Diadema antillarum TaxID=105358 RepID=UPI003A8923E5
MEALTVPPLQPMGRKRANSRDGVPQLTTKSSTDLLPIEMRLGTSKEAQPHAIVKQRQVQRLEVPGEPARRKSSTDIEQQRRAAEHHFEQSGAVEGGIYIRCSLNDMDTFAQLSTAASRSGVPTETAKLHGVSRSAQARDNGRQTAALRLGTMLLQTPFEILADEAGDGKGLPVIGMDVLRKCRCVIDLDRSILRVGGALGGTIPLLSEDDVFHDSRLVRSKSSLI